MTYFIPTVFINSRSLNQIIPDCIKLFCKLPKDHKASFLNFIPISYQQLKRCLTPNTEYDEYCKLNGDGYVTLNIKFLLDCEINHNCWYRELEFDGHVGSFLYYIDKNNSKWVLTQPRTYHMRNVIKNIEKLPQQKIEDLIKEGLIIRFNDMEQLLIMLQLKGLI